MTIRGGVRLGLFAAGAVLVALAMASCGVEERKLSLAPTGGTAGSGGDASATGGTSGQAGSVSGGAGGTGGAAGGDAAAGDASGGAPPSDVNGTLIVTHVRDNNEVNVPDNLSTYDPLALIPTPTGFDTLSGKGSAVGTFTIPKVPAGAYYLLVPTPQFVSKYFVMDSHSPDLSHRTIGRADAVEPTNLSGTKLSLDLTNLPSWAAGDEIDLLSGSAGLVAFAVDSVSDKPPAPGATSASFTFSWFDMPASFAPLVWSIDPVWALHLHSVTNGGTTYRVVERAAQLDFFAMTDGQTTVVPQKALVDVPQDKSLTFVWDCPAAEKALATANPGATITAESVTLSVLPGPPAGFWGSALDLLVYEAPLGAIANKGLKYGSPLSSSWNEFVSFYTEFSVKRQLPSTTTPATLVGGMLIMREASALVSKPAVGVEVGPITLADIDAIDFVAGGSIPPTATLSWTAPSVGTPTFYTATVLKLSASGTQTKSSVVGRITTSATSLRFPPGMLTKNDSFVIRLAAVARPGFDPSSPAKTSFPDAWANTISGLFTVK